MVDATRLNHAVLFVSDAEASAHFYGRVLGLEVIAREGPMVFLRAPGSENHHDLGLMTVGDRPKPPRGSIGLYHLAWEVAGVADLATVREQLRAAGAYVGQSDHGATKSIYGADPDGNEFEVMWLVPREDWGEHDRRAIVAPLDLEGEIAKYGG